MKNSIKLATLCTSLGCALLTGRTPAVAQDIGFFTNTTYKIVQLTGETDSTRRISTPSHMSANYCIYGTDLGSTFEHNGQLYFLFGDTVPGDSADFLGKTTASQPEDIFLNVYKDGTCFHPITIPGVSLGSFEIPSYGISVAGQIYLVATTDHNIPAGTVMGRSVMAVSSDDGFSFQKLYDLSALTNGGKFINVSMAEVNGQNFPSLPAEPCVLIWGSGQYRASNIRLAYIPSAQIGDRNALRYLSGFNAGTPLWSANETNAIDLFNQPQVGEFSVQYCQPLAQWVMLYNASSPRGINMRSARLPWGPWSTQPAVIFDGWRDNAYGRYMNVSASFGQWDVFSDTGRETEWGGEYGPYLIPRFFQGDQNRVKIVYTMSTWNPYQAILMQSDIGYPDRVHDVVTSSVTLPGDAAWIVSPPGLLHPSGGPSAIPYVTTYGNSGDANMGVAQYGFTASCSDQALEFKVHGGDAEVVLIEQTQNVQTPINDVPGFYTALKRGDYGGVVETLVGPRNNTIDLAVRWDLRRHRGKSMRLFVIDWLNQPWGFITVSQITRFFQPCATPLLSVWLTRTNTVAVSWPSPSTGFTLQQNTNGIASVNWSNVLTTPTDNGTTKTVIVNPPTGNRFFRLKSQ